MLLLVPLPRALDARLLSVLTVLPFRWAEINVRERLSHTLTRAGDVRAALKARREGVARAVERGGFELALSTTSYGMLLLAAGWVGEGMEYLRIAAAMTRAWPSGSMRDLALLALANGHAFRGEAAAAEETVAAIAAPTSARWNASLLALRGAEQRCTGDARAVDTYRAALDAAHLSGNRELVVVVNNNLAGTLTDAGDFAGAEDRLRAGDSLAPTTSPIRANLHGTRAELDLARGELDAARRSLDRSEALKAAAGIEGGIGWTLATRARLEAATGNRAEAKRLLDQAASSLQDWGALVAWRSAAAAIGEPEGGVGLAAPKADPLRDQVLALAVEVPNRAWEIHRGISYLIAIGMVFPLFWFARRLQDSIPGGWLTLLAAYFVLVLVILASYIGRRVPRR